MKHVQLSYRYICQYKDSRHKIHGWIQLKIIKSNVRWKLMIICHGYVIYSFFSFYCLLYPIAPSIYLIRLKLGIAVWASLSYSLFQICECLFLNSFWYRFLGSRYWYCHLFIHNITILILNRIPYNRYCFWNSVLNTHLLNLVM